MGALITSERLAGIGMSTLILGIETSCDETSAAVVKDGTEVLSNIISSQIDIHRQFGGVVPEVAARRHVQNVLPVIEESLTASAITLADVDAVAVTYGPGLVGALLVGVAAAKCIAFAKSIPLIGVQHIAGHIAANFLTEQRFSTPFLALVVSGGHTELVRVESLMQYTFLGRTRDDAVGEAFDKVARSIGIGYPGGPVIDRLAEQGNPEAYSFPRAWIERGNLDFSFSGLKSAVINALHHQRQKGEDIRVPDVAASFQAAVLDVLVQKTIWAVEQTGIPRVVVAGGVAANQGLRTQLQQAAEQNSFQVSFPPLSLCTDNAAMIAAAAYPLWETKKFAKLDLNAAANLSLVDWMTACLI
ncbi:MAG: O-sialoglycoprotein endopeptidase [Bacilli bacterium]|nr:O-sialoglycoprotein endopeptidase [Bacilli bacterium]